MCRIHELKSIFVYFYLFGQTTYIPLKSGCFKILSIVSFFPKILHFLVLIASIFTGLTQNNAWPNLSEFDTIILLVILLLSCISGILVFYSNLTYPFLSRTICKMFANVIQYTENRFFIIISTQNFKKKFILKIIFSLSNQIISSLTLIIFPNSFYKPIATYFLGILFIYKVMIMTHTVFYIDLMVFLLHSINFQLKILSRIRWRRCSISIKFKQIKWIHLKLWKISKIINKQFGWLFLFELIDHSMRSILCSYWLFLNIHNLQNTHIWDFIRM